MTQYVLDTNILLHDPNSFEQFSGHTVVIPMAVLENLDHLKRNTDELGNNARHYLRLIDSLGQKGDLSQGVKYEKVVIRILVDLKAVKNGFPLPIEKNRVLHAAYVVKEHEKSNVTLVTKDFLTRVKAEAIGIEAESYRTKQESYETLYKGVQKLSVSKNEIDRFYADGGLAPKKPLLPNEYAVMDGGENSEGIGKFNKKRKRIEPLLPIQRDIWGVKPLNIEQRCTMDLLMRDEVKLVTLVGQAGTGKTLLALACGLKKVLDEEVYSKILISRPIMPLGKDIGYLPGTKDEKLYHWMQPIFDNLEFLCEQTCGSGDPQETQNYILESKKIEMEAVTYIRGRTLPRMFIIIDEAQNLTPHEVKTIISRAGHGTKVVLMGDPSQIDNPYLDKDSNALTYIINRFKNESIFGHIYLEKTERSELSAKAADLL